MGPSAGGEQRDLPRRGSLTLVAATAPPLVDARWFANYI